MPHPLFTHIMFQFNRHQLKRLLLSLHRQPWPGFHSGYLWELFGVEYNGAGHVHFLLLLWWIYSCAKDTKYTILYYCRVLRYICLSDLIMWKRKLKFLLAQNRLHGISPGNFIAPVPKLNFVRDRRYILRLF